jgi:hypothetical protein
MADEDEIEDDSPLGAGEFHTIAQKQIMNAVFAVLAESKMDWALVEPFLQAAREVCAGDFARNSQIRLHSVRAEEEGWAEAEEAYLAIAVADRDSGEEWLSESYWLSDLATQDSSRGEVQALIAALERTIAKLNAWLADGGGLAGAAEAESGPEAP